MAFSQDEKPKYIHPKKIIRSIANALPPDLDSMLCLAVLALYVYSSGWHEADDLDDGYIRFKGSVSYSQVAAFCRRSYKSAQRYCEQLREKKMLTWSVGQHWIDFTVCLKAAQDEFEEEDTQNRLEDSRSMIMWKPIEGNPQHTKDNPEAYGMVPGGTERWLGGRCPDCTWEGEKRVTWCEDCYGEAMETSYGGTALQWAMNAPDDEYNGAGHPEDENVANDEERDAFIRKHRLMKELVKTASGDTDFEALWRGLSEEAQSVAKAGRT